MLKRITILCAFFFVCRVALAQSPVDIGAWLSSHHGKVFTRINQYNKQRYNVLNNQCQQLVTSQNQAVNFLNSDWNISTKANYVSAKPDAIDYTITFKCTKGRLDNASVSVDVQFDEWSEKNYVLMPSLAYNGNRYQWRRLRYSPKLYDVKDIGPDMPIILNDVPKLSESGGVSRIQERSGAMATPAVGFISDAEKKGIWLLTKQGNSLGDYGVGIEENRDRRSATITLTSPVVREQYLYKSCDDRSPSWDSPANFKAGDEVSITFRIYGFDAPETQTLFNKFATIRKDLTDSTIVANTLTYAAGMQLLQQKFNQKNFVPQYGYYAIGMRENYLQDWQIGWTGGMISTYPLLFAGDQQTRLNTLRNFDWLYPKGISPSGFYWDSGRNGTEWIGGDIRNPHTKNWHLVRKSGDAVWYIIKQFMLMDKMGISVKPAWKDGNQKVCDAFVKLWSKYHQLGQFVDSQTGDIIVGGSSSGAIVPAALALAAQYYHQPNYLETAKQIGAYYNANFTQKGISCGGPGDALQNFDSESAYALVESYVTLFETTHDPKWLKIAGNAAKQFSTWVVSYNYHFPDTSAYAKANIHTMGSVYANIQNKHTAPGICTASGVGLFKLYRYTGDVFYADLVKDIAHNIPQYLAHPQKPLGNMPFGYVSERVNMTDWEGPGTIGYILPLTTWAETSLMLTTIELPGLYVQPDKAFFIAFDNVAVKILSNTKKQLTLQLYNNTPVFANVSVLVENSKKSAEVMGENALYNNNYLVALKPSEAKVITLDK